jgi:hypothetical protein
MIPPALAYADTTDDAVAAAVAGDAVSDAAIMPRELTTLNTDIMTHDDDRLLAWPPAGRRVDRNGWD